MSQNAISFPLVFAQEIALKYIADLRPYCTRIEIAGSVRREKATVNDIEIVAVPNTEHRLDMFGNIVSTKNILDAHANDLAATWGAVLRKNGSKFKQFGLAEGLNLDLFLVTPPAEWGVIFTIRTGPGDFSNQVVTAKRSFTHTGRPGMLPSWAKCEDGRVVHRETGQAFAMPD